MRVCGERGKGGGGSKRDGSREGVVEGRSL